MPHHTSLITMLVAGFVLAFVLGAVANRLRLSPLVGYLLAGIIAGPYTPGFVADQQLAPQLAELGVILLMFGVGLHFSIHDLMQVRAVAVPAALARIGIVSALGWLTGRLFGWTDAAGWLFGLALSVASTVVLLRTLESHRWLDTRLGRITIGWVVVEDIAMVLALVLLPPLAGVLGSTQPQSAPLWQLLLFTAVKIVLFVATTLVVGRRVIPRLLERVAGTGSRELFTLCILAIALGVAYGAAALFGVSFALGAFFAGMLLNESEFSHRAAQDSLPLRDAFAVLFFVSVGMLFDPTIVVEHPLQVLATCVLIIVVRYGVGWGLLRALGESPQIATLGGASLAQIGEFSFILATLGTSLGVIDEDVRDLILSGALLSIILNPMLVGLVLRLDRHRMADTAPLQHDSNVPDAIRDHVIVVGHGRVGSNLVELLQARQVPVVLIEDDPERVQQARARQVPVVHGNAVLPEVLADAHPDRAQLVVLAVPQAFEAGEIVSRLKSLAPELTVLARAHSDAELQYLIERGADAAVLAERELAFSLAEMVLATPPYRHLRRQPSVAAA